VCLQNFGNIAHFQEVKIFHSKALVVNERPWTSKIINKMYFI
jgi:hypothetical protein